MSSSGPDPVERDSRGILDPWLLRQRVQLCRYPAGPALDGLVDRFWAVRWDLPPGTAHQQQVLTHPGANVSVGHANGERGSASRARSKRGCTASPVACPPGCSSGRAGPSPR